MPLEALKVELVLNDIGRYVLRNGLGPEVLGPELLGPELLGQKNPV